MYNPIERLICMRCRWYSESVGGHKKCYYGQPRCVIGWVAILLSTIVIALRVRLGKPFYRRGR